jgi:hypothetical protein
MKHFYTLVTFSVVYVICDETVQLMPRFLEEEIKPHPCITAHPDQRSRNLLGVLTSTNSRWSLRNNSLPC